MRNKSVSFSPVSPGYFATLGALVVSGRGFSTTDRAGTTPVAIANEALAKTLWPGENPLGQCFRTGDEPNCRVVVGVVKDVITFSIAGDPALLFYIPLSQNNFNIPVSALLVRTIGSPETVVPMLRRAILASEPSLIYATITPIKDRIEPQLRPWRLGSVMFGIYSGIALILAAFGLYGVLAYSVSQRTREIGIRMALGAKRGAVWRLVMQRGLGFGLGGTLIGLAVVLAGGHSIAPLLYHVSSRNALVLAVAAGVLIAVALFASYIPARRATDVDPMVALRYE